MVELTMAMKRILALVVLAMSGAACASTGTAPGWDGMALAERTIRDADAAGTAGSDGKPAQLIASAKSELAYAQHLPGDPAHAQRLCVRAQVDAELALVLVRLEAHERALTQAQARQDWAATAVSPVSADSVEPTGSMALTSSAVPPEPATASAAAP